MSSKVWYPGASITESMVGTQWPPFGCSPHSGEAGTQAEHDVGTLITNRVVGTVTNIYVRINTNTWAAGGSFQLRLKNYNGGSPTYQATTIVVSDGSTGYFSDLTTTLTIADGQELEWEWTRTGGGAGSLVCATYSYQVNPTTGSPFQWTGGEKTNLTTASTTRYLTPFGNNTHTNDENSNRVEMKVAGTVTKWGIRVFSNLRTTNTVFHIRKNGVDQDSVTFTASQIGLQEGAGAPFSVAVGDFLVIKVVTLTGTETLEYTTTPVLITPDANETQCGVQGAQSVSFGATEYWPIAGGGEISTTTDGNAKMKAPFAMVLDRFRGYVRANTLNTGSSTLNVRKNGIVVATLTWTIGSTPTGEQEDNTTLVAVLAGDELDVSLVASGASGAIEFRSLMFRVTEALPLNDAKIVIAAA